MTQEFTADEMLAVLSTTDQQLFIDTDHIRHPSTGRILKGGDGADDALNVQFSVEPVLSKLETHRQGRNVYVDQERITISFPNSLHVIHTPVTEYYKWRFPVDYAVWKRGQGEALVGTPLSLWPLITPSQLKSMESIGIRTVEQVAGLADSNATQFSGFHQLKARAQQFLDQSASNASATSLQLELDQRDKEHKAEVALLRAQQAEMMALLQSMQKIAPAEPVEVTDEKPAMRFGKPVKPKKAKE